MVLQQQQRLDLLRLNVACVRVRHTSLPDDPREPEPPDPIPNSDVKRFIADGSVGFPHVRVGHRQAPNKEGSPQRVALFY